MQLFADGVHVRHKVLLGGEEDARLSAALDVRPSVFGDMVFQTDVVKRADGCGRKVYYFFVGGELRQEFLETVGGFLAFGAPYIVHSELIFTRVGRLGQWWWWWCGLFAFGVTDAGFDGASTFSSPLRDQVGVISLDQLIAIGHVFDGQAVTQFKALPSLGLVLLTSFFAFHCIFEGDGVRIGRHGRHLD